jgi:uncharacterized membrane protein SirB2
VTYVILKYTHVAAVVASFTLFFVRGLWMMTAPEKLAVRWVRVVPHVIDTVLLVSAIALAAITAQYPFVQPWLTAKVLALLLYIILGTVAIRRGRTWRVRVVAWILALLVFGYIVAVARTRDQFPWEI